MDQFIGEYLSRPLGKVFIASEDVAECQVDLVKVPNTPSNILNISLKRPGHATHLM